MEKHRITNIGYINKDTIKMNILVRIQNNGAVSIVKMVVRNAKNEPEEFYEVEYDDGEFASIQASCIDFVAYTKE